MTKREEAIDLIDRVLEISDLTAQYNGCKTCVNFVHNDKLFYNVQQIGFDGTARVYTKDFSVNQLTKPMRYCVYPDNGKKFLYFDLKAAEWYILMYWSKCNEGTNWYNSGLDPHREVMARLLNKEEITKEDRAVSKVLSFATIYGGNEYTISKDLNCDLETAIKFQSDYNALFPEINQFKAKLTDYAHRTGYTSTMFGRFRALPNINSLDDYDRAKSERQAVNTAIQASCADFLKMMSIKCFENHPEVKIKFQVFDSLLLQVDENMTDEQAVALINELVDFSDRFPGFKFRYDWSFGSSWGEAQANC